VKKVCGECDGARLINQQRKVDVVIEPGMRPGENIIFPRECSDQVEYEEAGDLHIILVDGHVEGVNFIRLATAPDDMGTEVAIGVCDALTGCTVVQQGHPGHPQGLTLEIPAGVQNGEVVKVAGEGMPVRGGAGRRGDLHVRVKVVMKESEKVALADAGVRAQIRAVFSSAGAAAGQAS
jgi:DnaJ-class molecular chaperone